MQLSVVEAWQASQYCNVWRNLVVERLSASPHLAFAVLLVGNPGCLVLYFDTMMLVALMMASTSSPLLIFIS